MNKYPSRKTALCFAVAVTIATSLASAFIDWAYSDIGTVEEGVIAMVAERAAGAQSSPATVSDSPTFAVESAVGSRR